MSTTSPVRAGRAASRQLDVAGRESFEHVDGWLDDLRKVRGDEAIVALVGNKCDLDENGARYAVVPSLGTDRCGSQVSFAEGEALAQKWGAKIFREASAKTG